MYIDLTEVTVFLLVALRMTGMLVFNPIFGRRNVPVMVNTALALLLAVVLTSSMDFPAIPEPTLFSMLYMSLKELAVGMVAGFIIQMVLSVLVISGEVIDMQLGLSMSKVFDPATNASISLTSTLFNVLFTLLFFITNNHLTLIQMTAQTFTMIPPGVTEISNQLFLQLAEMFSLIMVFAMKLCLPIAVVEVIVTFAVGILTRIIPQINVFVVNIQFKLLIGIFALLVLVPPFTGFMENLIVICFENVQAAWAGFS